MSSYTIEVILEPSEKDLIKGCLNGLASSQRLLYKRYAGKMFVVCRRYANSREETEDILQEGFITVFKKLSQFKMEGSFEGWIRRIMVSRAIEHYRKMIRMFPVIDIEGIEEKFVSPENVLSNIATKDLLEMIQELPLINKLVFNLFIFEDKSHKEIAQSLNIAEGTSKSALFHARIILRKKIKMSMMVAQNNSYNEKRL